MTRKESIRLAIAVLISLGAVAAIAIFFLQLANSSKGYTDVDDIRAIAINLDKTRWKTDKKGRTAFEALFSEKTDGMLEIERASDETILVSFDGRSVIVSERSGMLSGIFNGVWFNLSASMSRTGEGKAVAIFSGEHQIIYSRDDA